jgi:hypothetical protein
MRLDSPQFVRELASWMQYVPRRAVLVLATASGIFVAKPVDNQIPHGMELLDQHVLTKGNEYLVHDERSKTEISNLQVGSSFVVFLIAAIMFFNRFARTSHKG